METNETNDYVPVKDRAKIAAIVTRVESHLLLVKRNVFEIGKCLSEAKHILPHGTFQRFITEHFNKELPYCTANLYMKIYDKFRLTPKAVLYLPITFLLRLTDSSFPDLVLNIIMENSTSDSIDYQIISDAFTRFKNKEIDLPQFEAVAKDQIDLATQMEWGRTEKRNSKAMADTTHNCFRALSKAVSKIDTMTNNMIYFLYPEQKKDIVKDIDDAISKLEKLKLNLDNKTYQQILVIEPNSITGRRELVANN
jgi:hypothetical protein